jgi:hypothetical protein
MDLIEIVKNPIAFARVKNCGSEFRPERKPIGYSGTLGRDGLTLKGRFYGRQQSPPELARR